MSEHWPPEWDEPDSTDRDDGQRDDGLLEAGRRYPGLPAGLLADHLAEVTAALRSAPPPALPDALAARVNAAIAAEAAARTEQAGASGESATARSFSRESSFPAAAGGGAPAAPPARSRRPGPRHGARRPRTTPGTRPAGTRPRRRVLRRLASPQGIGSLVVCLVIAGFGYLIVNIGGPSASSSFAAPASAASPAYAGTSGRAANAPLPEGAQRGSGSRGAGFAVSETGTRYEPATLAGQVRAALTATAGGSVPPSVTQPSASASAAASASASGAGGLPPSAALAGCVRRLTGGVTPSLVDRASYAGRQAYVIAVPSRAWVVGLGCTAANPQLITSVTLAGLSGNLCALGSV